MRVICQQFNTSVAKRCFFQMGSGLGKSFVMAHVTTVLLLQKLINRVKIVFSEAELRDNESAIIDKIRTISGGQVDTVLMNDVDKLELPTGQLTIVDECDRLYYGDTLRDRLPAISGDGFLLGLSATGLSDQTHELRYIITDLKMRCFKSNWVSHDSLTREKEVDSFETFLEAAKDDGKLVHCEERDLEEMKQIAAQRNLTVHHDVSDPA